MFYKWPIEEECGYVPKTTFWTDFSIAESFGLAAIRETYNRAFHDWREDYIYLTELVMVLNWKIFQWYKDDKAIAELYESLWRQADEYATNNLSNDELSYYYKTTD